MYLDTVYDYMTADSLAAQIFLGIAIVVLIYILLRTIHYAHMTFAQGTLSRPKILNGLHSSSVSFVVSQNPKHGGSKLLRRSVDEKNGIEFSYTMWVNIEGWDTQPRKWKHMFHKGAQFDDTGDAKKEPHDIVDIQAPGMWLHPETNEIRVYMNTFKSTREFLTIDNIPISKWFHIAIVLSHRHLDVYINGFLRKRMTLNGVPKQNYYDLHVSKHGGFQGHYSNMQYYNYALSMAPLQMIVKKGPNFKMYNDDDARKSHIPYLADTWWTE